MGIGKGKKSILEPYYPEMYSLRKKGQTYQGITNHLNEKYNLKLWKNQVYSFLKRREKKKILPKAMIRNTGDIKGLKTVKNQSKKNSFDLFNLN